MTRRDPLADAPGTRVPGVRGTLVVLAVLLVLTAATVGLAFVALPAPLHPILALVIAASKAGLVAAYFMHLAHEERVIRAVAVTGALCLAILFLLVLVDFAASGA